MATPAKTLPDFFKKPAAKRHKRVSSPPLPISSLKDDASASASSMPTATISPEQKQRMEYSKSLALSKRNLKLCSDKVSKEVATGLRTSSLRKDPAWKYAVQIDVPGENAKKGYKYLKCNFCNKKITGGVKRAKDHLAGNHNNVAPCSEVPQEVKDEIVAYMKAFESTKHTNQQRSVKLVDSGSYFGDGTNNNLVEDTNSCSSGSRGVGGSTDQFTMSKGEDCKMTNVFAADKMTIANGQEHRNRVCLEIGSFFFENGIPFDCANSASFIDMVRSIGLYGRNLEAPSVHEMSTWILQEEVQTTSKMVDDIKTTWKQTGVSLLLDGWLDIRNRSLINFLVNNQKGTLFLRSVDASNCLQDARKLFELIDSVVEEIGEDIVVQVITSNTSAFKEAGRLLMEKRTSLYWTPCVTHCIDLMLERIGELSQHKHALVKAKRVCNFIYNHHWMLTLIRKFAGKDIFRPSVTPFATAYLTLESICLLKQPLQSMFASSEWVGSAWSKKAEGKAVKKIIMDENSFWRNVVYSIKTSGPLVHVLRMVNSEKTPAMGFIYGAMDEAKEKIAKNFDGEVSSYKEIWDIIDEKWDSQMHCDLHACAYYLNPRFRWSDNVSQHPEIKRGFYNCMERMIKDNDKFLKVDAQLDEYTFKRGLFAYRAALASCTTRSPIDWWDQFGDDVPELKAFAMKVLSLSCSTSTCERKWNTLNQVHSKRRNRQTTSKLNSLVYVMYNNKLRHKYLKNQSRSDKVDSLIVDDVPSDDEWIANPNPNDDEDAIEIVHEGTNSTTLSKMKRNQASKRGVGYVKLEELLVEETWSDVLSGELQKPYAKKLCEFVESEICHGSAPVYPPQHLIFNALNTTRFDCVKAVIIGQDPYHGPGQAMGLSFSVPEGIKVPSSLQNIYKELQKDLGCSIPSSGNLEKWAIQGVLLLNAVLTVRHQQANSHSKRGWEQFTDAVIGAISQKKRGVVFLLWGNFAQAKSRLIDESKHHILKSAHPSGLSANRGFFGCRHFSRTNEILEKMGISPIDWQL